MGPPPRNPVKPPHYYTHTQNPLSASLSTHNQRTQILKKSKQQIPRYSVPEVAYSYTRVCTIDIKYSIPFTFTNRDTYIYGMAVSLPRYFSYMYLHLSIVSHCIAMACPHFITIDLTKVPDKSKNYKLFEIFFFYPDIVMDIMTRLLW